MAIEQLAAWGEFIGGIAVVAGLVFVGVQLLTANKETRASTLQDTIEIQMLLDVQLAKYSGTWEKVINNLPIEDAAERRRAIILFNMVMNSTENRYHQFQAGYLDKKSWDAGMEALHKTLQSNIYFDWRKTAGAAAHSLDFLEIIDHAVKQSE